MKKTITLMLLSIICVSLFSQNTIEHLTFADIPIDGKRSDFLKKMTQKGFRYFLINKDQCIIMKGNIWENDCYIYLESSVTTDEMNKVSVEFPYHYTWTELSTNYFSIKDSLVLKYGQPSECYEKFLSDSLPNNDQDKLESVDFNTTFNTMTGIIKLYIERLKRSIQVEYIDKTNASLAEYESDILMKQPKRQVQTSNNEYKLFPTSNMWNFIKLNTRNGKMWQVQWHIEEDKRFENILSSRTLVPFGEEKVNDRFTLYPTTNTHNFILLDQIDGRTWQVQWSFDKNKRMVIPID